MPIESLQSLVKLTHLMNAVKLCDEIPLPSRLLKDIKYESELPHEIFLDRWFESPRPRSKILYYWGESLTRGPGSRKCLDVKRRIPADKSVLYLRAFENYYEAMDEYDFIIYFQNDWQRRGDVGWFLAELIHFFNFQRYKRKRKADIIILADCSPETVLRFERIFIPAISTRLVCTVRHEERTSSTDARLDSWILNPGGKVLYVWGRLYHRTCADMIHHRISHDKDLVHISPLFELYEPDVKLNCYWANKYLNPSASYKYLMVTGFQFSNPCHFLINKCFEYKRNEYREIREGTNIIIVADYDPVIAFKSHPEYLDRIYVVNIP